MFIVDIEKLRVGDQALAQAKRAHTPQEASSLCLKPLKFLLRFVGSSLQKQSLMILIRGPIGLAVC
jgi:hypothetical protein